MEKSKTEAAHVLLTGWVGLEDGEATAGDALATSVVSQRLTREGISHDVAWSRVMCPPDGIGLADVDPRDYTHVVFACGPLHGEPIERLHQRFAHAVRLAVDVTVIDSHDAAVTGFDHVIARDRLHRGADGGVTGTACRDLSALAQTDLVGVVGVFLTHGQGEYGQDRRHEDVVAHLQDWLLTLDVARLPLDTRLDPRDWRHASTPDQLASVVARLDAIVTMRLHGLVIALCAGVPAVAVDPVAGGGKVSAQAAAWGWPAVVTADELTPDRLDEHFAWCCTPRARAMARAAARACGGAHLDDGQQLDRLVRLVKTQAEAAR